MGRAAQSPCPACHPLCPPPQSPALLACNRDTLVCQCGHRCTDMDYDCNATPVLTPELSTHMRTMFSTAAVAKCILRDQGNRAVCSSPCPSRPCVMSHLLTACCMAPALFEPRKPPGGAAANCPTPVRVPALGLGRCWFGTNICLCCTVVT